MSNVTAVRITNIVSVSLGGTVIEGVRSVTININKGKVVPILKEGDMYPTDSENVGMPDFPVTTTTEFETDIAASMAMLAQAKGDYVITCRYAGGGAGTKAITIANHEFGSAGGQQGLQAIGTRSLPGFAHSNTDAGTTLPIVTA